MKITEQKQGDVLILTLSGELIGGDESKPFQDLLYKAIESGSVAPRAAQPERARIPSLLIASISLTRRPLENIWLWMRKGLRVPSRKRS